ncbi:Serine carboxypeptidase 44 [Theobroma cacao]|uniref:Serine carboxypeptidase 44 n=1 Tax=Theobroma cacao TaxID=3641 RepID=A0A061F6Q8_THECC|nr:Serine carboxypeptidase 44 [Theobroma cacao]
MDNRVVFVGLFLFAFGGVNGFPMNDLIEKLPGQPNVTFRQFSGYIDVDGKFGRSLFYYFVEAENDPMNRPLTIWLTGGPGCGSVGDGFLSVGPFITTANAHGLQRNLYSWIKVSNLLFIDSPVGAGWSYSNTSSDYEVGDDSTNNDLLAFILQWFEKYPNFKSRDLYLGGSSYAGHFIPNFANALLDYNKQSNNFKFNIKGLAVTKVSYEVDMCIPFRADFYFNILEVQKAFHGNRTNLGYQWKGCFEKSGLKFSDVDKDIDMLPALKKILQQSIPITIFSGDQDAIVPTVGTLNHVNKLAKDMNLNLTKDEAWNHGNKGGGWMYSYGDLLTLMTVKGANHHVTFSKPSEALFIFTNAVINRSH